jgi:hypothetical protein
MLMIFTDFYAAAHRAASQIGVNKKRGISLLPLIGISIAKKYVVLQ